MTDNGRFAARLKVALAVGAVGGLLGACSSSNGGFNDPVEDMLGDPLVMMGLKVDPSKEDIEYGPRSPLVMPSANEERDLPPPMDTTASYGAQWPNDPDEARKRQEAELRAAALNEKPRDVEYVSKPMTPGELDEWGRMYGNTNGSGVAVGPRKYGGKDDNKVVSPRELLDRRKDPNQLKSEPPRTSLNEPPPGYRTPAPPVEGYGEPEKKKGFFARLFNKS
jgi:hypothetical protein